METKKRPQIVILGDFIHEGVSSQITQLGYDLITKTLYGRTSKTWAVQNRMLESIINSGDLKAVILYLATPLFFQALGTEYSTEWHNLLALLKKIKSTIFVFEDNLSGNFNFYDSNGMPHGLEHVQNEIDRLNSEDAKREELKLVYFQSVDKENLVFPYKSENDDRLLFKLKSAHQFMTRAKECPNEIAAFIDSLQSSGIDLIAFRNRGDVTSGIHSFLTAISQGIFFTIYVNNHQLFHEQFRDFIRIFERYLQEVEGISFMVDSQSTANGTAYSFKSINSLISLPDFSLAVSRFDNFMTLCKDVPKRAEEVLMSKGMPKEQVNIIIAEYVKKYQRLAIDIKHSFEQNKLLIQQNFENSILEASIDGSPLSIVSSSNVFTTALMDGQNSLSLSPSLEMINYFDIEEVQILKLANKYEPPHRLVEIRTCIEELKDKDLPISTRKVAKSKISTFLFTVGKKAAKHAEDIGIKLLSAYLEKKVIG